MCNLGVHSRGGNLSTLANVEQAAVEQERSRRQIRAGFFKEESTSRRYFCSRHSRVRNLPKFTVSCPG